MNPTPKLVSTFALTTCLTGCVIVPDRPHASASYSPDSQGPQVEIVAEADVTPVAVEQYYFVGGRYYYWHPGERRYVLLRGRPPEGHRIIRRDHLTPRDRSGHPVRNTREEQTRVNQPARPTRPAQTSAARPQPQRQQQAKKEPEKKSQ